MVAGWGLEDPRSENRKRQAVSDTADFVPDDVVGDSPLQQSWPDIIAERCVHALSPVATCNACVDACPRQAWILDDRSLALDVESCDGCGLCVPACPEAAVELDLTSSIHAARHGSAAFAACEYAEVTRERGQIPCLHALDPRALIRMRLRGIRSLVVASGACASCHRNGSKTLKQSVHEIGLLLADRDLEPLELIELSGDAWQAERSRAEERTPPASLSRRHFFTAVTSCAKEKLREASDQTPALGTLLPSRGENDLLPFFPEIDVRDCQGCDACLGICPHNVIQFNRSAGEGASYTVAAARCTGCGLCVDLCEAQAIRLRRWERLQNNVVELEEAYCRACGNLYHLPQGRMGPDHLCPICTRTGHHRQLYQVLD